MRAIFLPEKLFNVRLVPKRVLSVSIDHAITATIVNLHRNHSTIEELHYKELEHRNAKYIQEVLFDIVSAAGNYDSFVVSIPASLVTFKYITLPFNDVEKIRMVIGSEVEPLLPFSVDEAILDFIVLEREVEESSYQILVSAIRKQDLDEAIEHYTAAGIRPTHVTVDFISLFNLYKQIPAYTEKNDTRCLIDVHAHATHVALIYRNRIRLIRSIQKGYRWLFETISKEAEIPIDELKKHLKNFGIAPTSKKNLDSIVKRHLTAFLGDIQFTINSFSLKLNLYSSVNKTIFTRIDFFIKHFTAFAQNILQIPVESLNVHKILTHESIKTSISQPSREWNFFASSLGGGLPSLEKNTINFYHSIVHSKEKAIVKQQISAALVITTTLVCFLLINGYIQIHTLSKSIATLERRELKRVKAILSRHRDTIREPGMSKLISRALKDKKLGVLAKNMKRIALYEESQWKELEKLKIDPLRMLFKLTHLIDTKPYIVRIGEISLSNDDTGNQQAEVTGTFKSKKEGEDFRDFAKFKQSFEEARDSRSLFLDSSDEVLGDGGSVRFTLLFKQRGRIR